MLFELYRPFYFGLETVKQILTTGTALVSKDAFHNAPTVSSNV